MDGLGPSSTSTAAGGGASGSGATSGGAGARASGVPAEPAQQPPSAAAERLREAMAAGSLADLEAALAQLHNAGEAAETDSELLRAAGAMRKRLR